MYREKTSKVVDGRAWTEDDTALLTDMTEEEQTKVTAWIRENILPRKTPLLSHSSYGMKHLLERDTKIYMTNNQFKDAMLQCGFKPQSFTDYNWRYSLHRRSPALTYRYYQYSPAMTPADEKNKDGFYYFMMKYYRGENSPAGDFAEDMYYDLTLPRKNNRETLRRYLEIKHACNEALEAFEECWQEYKDSRKHANEH